MDIINEFECNIIGVMWSVRAMRIFTGGLRFLMGENFDSRSEKNFLQNKLFLGHFFSHHQHNRPGKKREYQDCAVQPPIFPAELWVLDTDFYIDKQ